MAELLKNNYDKAYINKLAKSLKSHYSPFPEKKFSQLVFHTNWEDKELKDRMQHICDSIFQSLNLPYKKAVPIIIKSAKNFGGFEGMFFPAYIETYGLIDSKNWDISIKALEKLTQYSSSEFAVRPFIVKAPKKMMAQMKRWASHENYHVRRLASEGCRPRLPWAMALPEFKLDPSIIIPILEKLKADEEDYVYRSVANNLNDISKDHPEVVLDIAERWIGKTKETDWLVKHALRTLLKKSNSRALALFGYFPATDIKTSKIIVTPVVKIGEKLDVSFNIKNSKQTSLGMLRLEYAIDYMKANGKTSQKVFKISEGDYTESTKNITRKHSFKEMSTRKHYAGIHRIRIIINGQETSTAEFEVKA